MKGFGTIGSPQVYKINCCGVLKRWKILPLKVGIIDFHVWRPTSGGQFRLLNRNRHEVVETDIGHIRLISLPKSVRISVEPNDIIGWYQPGEAIVAYGSGEAVGYLQKPMPDPYKAEIPADWKDGIEVKGGRTYAVEAIGDENSPPSFVESQFLNMSNKLAPGSEVFKIEVTDEDKNDIDYLEVSMETPSPYFDVNAETRQLVVKEMPPLGSHTVYLRVRDHCNATASGTVAVNVYDAPHPPTDAPTRGPDIHLGGPAEMNRLDSVPGDGRHLWVIGVILALAIVATAITFVIFLGRKGVLPIRGIKTNPCAPRKKPNHNDVKAKKTSQQTPNKDGKSPVTKEKASPKAQQTQEDKIVV